MTAAVTPEVGALYQGEDGSCWQVLEVLPGTPGAVVVVAALDRRGSYTGPVSEVALEAWNRMAVARGLGGDSHDV